MFNNKVSTKLYLITILFGWFGAHKFYQGRADTGIVYFLMGVLSTILAVVTYVNDPSLIQGFFPLIALGLVLIYDIFTLEDPTLTE